MPLAQVKGSKDCADTQQIMGNGTFQIHGSFPFSQWPDRPAWGLVVGLIGLPVDLLCGQLLQAVGLRALDRHPKG